RNKYDDYEFTEEGYSQNKYGDYEFTEEGYSRNEYDYYKFTEEEGYTQNKYDDYEHSNDEFLSDEEKEYEYNYGIFIKLENGTALPVKWYTSKIFMVNELLSEIHQNIEVLTKRNPIEPGSYHVAFKSEKAMGAGTQLDLELNDALDNDINMNFKNNNSIPKASNLSPNECEDTKDYYQRFLSKFEQQKITIRLLSKLSNNDFEKCSVDTISKQQTLHEYAENYNLFCTSNNTLSVEKTSTYSLLH
ncbi:24830_t:CDS:2, partial [Gigaspora margarita]